MKKAKIVYGLVLPGAYEKEVENGDVILGGCCVGSLGDYGYVCPVDGEWYVIKNGKLVNYEDALNFNKKIFFLPLDKLF